LIPIGNLFDNIPAHLPDELVEVLAQSDDVRIERIVSRGHASAEGIWYDQDWSELVLLLSGSASLAVDGTDRKLSMKPGDYLLIPAHRRHRVVDTAADTDTVWLAVHFRRDVPARFPR
jgi:cupin 2 domain-containing protein